MNGSHIYEVGRAIEAMTDQREQPPSWMPSDKEIERAIWKDNHRTVEHIRALIHRAGIKAQIEAYERSYDEFSINKPHGRWIMSKLNSLRAELERLTP